jgi:hypothetical protein
MPVLTPQLLAHLEQNIDWKVQIVQQDNSDIHVTDLDRVEYSITPDMYALLNPQLQTEILNYVRWWRIGRRRPISS